MVYENVNLPVWRATRHLRGARILDVGCGTGALGARLAALGNHVEGITHDPDEAAVAAGRLAAVHVLDLDEPAAIGRAVDLPGFDTVILSNVLEHLRDPLATLHGLDPLLDTGAPAYVALPNVACFWVRAGLLAGRFTPRNDGILDRTHLHHYTLRTARQLLADADLTVDWVDVMPGVSVWLYQGVKRSRGGGSAAEAAGGGLALYEEKVFPAERAVTRLWKRMLANEFLFACRRGPRPVPRP
jgi:2-polyprenyl-3-methyl-5-hydroxy-6-metoxy-1,4-benzoquinol methylase